MTRAAPFRVVKVRYPGAAQSSRGLDSRSARDDARTLPPRVGSLSGNAMYRNYNLHQSGMRSLLRFYSLMELAPDAHVAERSGSDGRRVQLMPGLLESGRLRTATAWCLGRSFSTHAFRDSLLSLEQPRIQS